MNFEREKVFRDKTPEDLRADFKKKYREQHAGSFPTPLEGQAMNEATTQVDAYEVLVDPLNPGERRYYTHEMPLRAFMAGFEIVATTSVPHAGFLENGHEITAITYFIKGPRDEVRY